MSDNSHDKNVHDWHGSITVDVPPVKGVNLPAYCIDQMTLPGFEQANCDNKLDIDNDSLPDKTKNTIKVSQHKNDENRHSNDSSSISDDVSRSPSDSEIEATSKSATVVDVSYISYMILVL